MRWRLAAFGATLTIVAGTGVTYVFVTQNDRPSTASRSAPTPTASSSASPTRPPSLGALAPDAPMPTPQVLARRLRRAVAAPELGGALGAFVVDAATGRPLFVRRPDV